MPYVDDIKAFSKRGKQMSRLLDNYFVPENTRLSAFKEFLKNDVLPFVNQQNKTIIAEKEDEFGILCSGIRDDAIAFLAAKQPDGVMIENAKALLLLILNTESYLIAVERVPWSVGRKVSFLEKRRIRAVFRRKLHSLVANGRPVRGTRVYVELCGSLTRGASDYKFLMNTDSSSIPKPSDWGIPKQYRKLDDALNVPFDLKSKMSDVDILIMNDVIFDSVNPSFSFNGWSFKLGEKYKCPLGPILESIHQALENTKIGGIKGRWVNYIIVRDAAGLAQYKENHETLMDTISQATTKTVVCMHTLILDEIIH